MTARAALLLLAAAFLSSLACGRDERIRVVRYSPDEVFPLTGYVGYQIDLEFESGESFVGLGAGDIQSLAFAAQGAHLFLKPRAAAVATNLTVITTRRSYQFAYSVSAQPPDATQAGVLYVLRFTYPPGGESETTALEHGLAGASASRAHNFNYGYCGSPALRPSAAWDDGVQTHLSFAARQELPAIFARNDDGSESLVNFHIEAGEVIVHHLGRQLLVRRGRLSGSIVNLGFAGAGERLESGTLAPHVQRLTKGQHP